MFAIEEILSFVPHRYPFLLIDRVLAFTKDRSVKTLKNITINEAHFQGHFPRKPIFPGVYIIENMAQSVCFLLAKSAGGLDENMVYVLGKVMKMSFLKPVFPGDQLVTQITLERTMGSNALVSARSSVEETIVAKGDLMFGVVPETPEEMP
jgi:3-hydroxyacyl-[acyl-carrier-protein] dehydratase